MTAHHAWLDVRRAMDAIWPLMTHHPVASVRIDPHLITVHVVGIHCALSLAAALGADEREHRPVSTGRPLDIRGHVDGTPIFIVGLIPTTVGGTA